MNSLENNKKSSSENKNLFIALVLSFLFVTLWDLFIKPKYFPNLNKKNIEQVDRQNNIADKKNEIELVEKDFITKSSNSSIINNKKNEVITLANENFQVDIDIENARIIQTQLNKFHDKNGNNVNIINDQKNISFGSLSDNSNSLANKWTVIQKTKNSLILKQENKDIQNIIQLKLEDDYLINVKQENTLLKDGKVTNYIRMQQEDNKNLYKSSFTFSGVVGFLNNEIRQKGYKTIKKENGNAYENHNSWFGFTDQYWLAAIGIKDNDYKYNIRYNDKLKLFQIDYSNTFDVEKGKTIQSNSYIYLGPKNIQLLNKVSQKLEWKNFDKSIDFGLFYFIAKPLLNLLKLLYGIFDNFGLAIIFLTIIVRIAILPLGIKSFHSMNKMKKIAPKLKELQETFKDNKQALQPAILKMYQENNINPLATFIPLLFQIPIFFALYKVLMISIEMREAPFYFWIKDLSDPDPSSVFNLFGLINIDISKFPKIGLLPILMGFTMWLQNKITPTASTGVNSTQDQSQQLVMKYMPVIFVMMSLSFPSGLILYWIVSNLFTVVQNMILNYLYS